MGHGVYSQQDEQLERDIDVAYRALIASTLRDARLTAAETMRRMIALRSPERIAAMERDKGLA